MAAKSGWLIANLVAQIAFGFFAMAICIPSMQEWKELLNTSQASVQLSFSAFIVAFAVGLLVWGPLSDQYGRRRMLAGGAVIAGLASIAAALATGIEMLTLARIVQGIGASAGGVVARAMVQDQFDGSERTRVMAYIGAAMGLSPVVSSLLGGYIHVTLGWQANFYLIAGLSVLLMFLIRALPGRRLDHQLGPATIWGVVGGFGQLIRDRRFRACTLLSAGAFGAFLTFMAGSPVVLGGFGVGPEHVGLYIMAAPLCYIVGNLMTTRLVGRFSESQLMSIGYGLSMMSLALVVLTQVIYMPTALAFVLPMTLFGLGNGLTVPTSLVGTVGAIPALAGSAAALAGLTQQLSGALGSFLVGLVPHQGAINLIVIMTVLAMPGLYSLTLLRRMKDL